MGGNTAPPPRIMTSRSYCWTLNNPEIPLKIPQIEGNMYSAYVDYKITQNMNDVEISLLLIATHRLKQVPH